jgi:hypothetical protein
VDVVTAGVEHVDGVPLVVDAADRAGVGQLGLLLHRQGVHVRPEQRGGTVAVAQHPDHAGPAHPGRRLVTQRAQAPRDDARGPLLLERQLGMLMQVPVDRREVIINSSSIDNEVIAGHDLPACWTSELRRRVRDGDFSNRSPAPRGSHNLDAAGEVAERPAGTSREPVQVLPT